jgi:hypothetical protein
MGNGAQPRKDRVKPPQYSAASGAADGGAQKRYVLRPQIICSVILSL